LKTIVFASFVVLLALGVASCGHSVDRSTTVESKEVLYQRGHQRYLQMQLDAAEEDLRKAVAIDSSYQEALVDLGFLMYDRAQKIAEKEDPQRIALLKDATMDLARAEAAGARDAEVYERLCELSSTLKDDRRFLTYASKFAERYPSDRQYYNLGVALEGVGDWQGIVKSQKAAVEKFKTSPYLGGFYRQMARAYMKMDRNQTAERVLTAGLTEVDRLLEGASRTEGKSKTSAESRRWGDDRIGILLLLKHIHTQYRDTEKLERVERQLKDAGFSK
jgi:tetratricopeptide (TPR) repeat protein